MTITLEMFLDGSAMPNIRRIRFVRKKTFVNSRVAQPHSTFFAKLIWASVFWRGMGELQQMMHQTKKNIARLWRNYIQATAVVAGRA